MRSTFGSSPVGRLEEERVVLLARRVADREVQRGEVVVIGLDVRAFGDGEAHVGEDGRDLVRHLADRVDAAGGERVDAAGQGDVDALGGELRFERRLAQRLAPCRRSPRSPAPSGR